MILRLSLRNLFRHTGSSLILLLLISSLSALFFIGESVLRQSDSGLRSTYVENLTADLVLQKEGEVSMNLFGANTPIIDEFFTLPVLPAYSEVRRIVAETAGVRFAAGQVSGQALMDVKGVRAPVPLCGVEAESYFDLFPGLTILEGDALTPGREGVLITHERAVRIEKQSGKPLSMGAPVRLTTAGNTGFKIREVPLSGIFRYRNPGPFMEEVVICDPQTVRALSSILLASPAKDPPPEAADLLSASDEALFGPPESAGSSSAAHEPAASGASAAGASTLDLLRTALERPQDSGPQAWRGGDWNFLLLRLEPGASAPAVRKELNNKLKSLGVKAVGWRTAAGNTALLVLLIRTLFGAGMALVSAAGIVAMVNILLIAVFRRTREIGTLRAIGASSGTVTGLILTENLLLALIAGILGSAAGAGILAVINGLQWPIPNDLIAALLGSRILNVALSFPAALRAAGLALLLGLAASLFPLKRALRVEPLVAVRRG